MPHTLKIVLILIVSAFNSPAMAGNPIQHFGNFYTLPEASKIPKGTTFKIAFDVAEQAELGQVNGHINSLARFVNMHVAHGVAIENIELALVVHGGASKDMLADSFYQGRFEHKSSNHKLIEQLLATNTKVYLCGQSASYHKVTANQLIPGVEMQLSAMTAHALLQQQGYTLNPF